MRLLLDTHSFLWFIMGNDKLNSQARELITESQKHVWPVTFSMSPHPKEREPMSLTLAFPKKREKEELPMVGIDQLVFRPLLAVHIFEQEVFLAV